MTGLENVMGGWLFCLASFVDLDECNWKRQKNKRLKNVFFLEYFFLSSPVYLAFCNMFGQKHCHVLLVINLLAYNFMMSWWVKNNLILYLSWSHPWACHKLFWYTYILKINDLLLKKISSKHKSRENNIVNFMYSSSNFKNYWHLPILFHLLFPFFFLVVLWIEPKGLVHMRQVFYHWAIWSVLPSPI